MTLSFRKTFAEVNLANLKSNFDFILSVAGKDRFVCPMIKANAYGHGAVKVAQALLKYHHVPLGVALIEEALELRQAGIKSEIIVFGGFDQHGAKKMIEAQLTPVVSQFEQFEYLRQHVTEPISVHVKFNTGMNRLGFLIQDVEQIAGFLKNNPKIKMQAVLSHLHSAHLLEQKNSLSLRQVQLMTEILDFYKEYGVFAHLLNSDGIAVLSKNKTLPVLSETAWGFRPGIMLYGYCSPELNINQLKPVMTVRSYIQSLQKIKSGESVSYNASWKADKESVIGVVPIGYADGVHRAASHRAQVVIDGQKIPVVGKVCMDFLMVDVTELKNPSPLNADVLVFGEESQSAEDFARYAETISYEVLTSISSRVPRLYNGENS